ncbi:MAG TPA: hypothetical protein VMT03_00885 [Polyangia bacterium]|nr:hypothetical protein [Polyangia bacterium]
MLFERPENGMVGCKNCPNDYFVPIEFPERPDRQATLLTVCCRKPIAEFSRMTYSCPEHAFRHILPLTRVEPQIRAWAESPQVKKDLADKGRRFTRGILIFFVGFFVLVAAYALARR